MGPFEWDDKYSVDIPQMDAQHRQIIELLDDFRKCADSSERDLLIQAALESLNQYAELHLRREELMLRTRGYPKFAEHCWRRVVLLPDQFGRSVR